MATSSNDTRYHDLSEVLPGRDNWNVKVRVVRLWRVPSFLNPSEPNSIEMILCDEKGGKIDASIRKQLIHMFDKKIEQGQVYEMPYLSVSPQFGLYRTTLHPYKFIFQVKTKVQICESDLTTNYGFSFTNCAAITAHTRDYKYLVDVIGLITGISAEKEYIRDGKLTKMVVIELTDDSGKCECALFGDYVDELNKMMGKGVEGLPIVIIQYAKVKIFRDKASIQNVINTTRILLNPDLPEIETFKNGIAVHGIEMSAAVPLIGSKPAPSVEEEFLGMHPKKTFAELIDIPEDGIFAVHGSIVGVVGGQDWWYPACKCHKSVTPDSGAYYCSGCMRHVFHVVPRFKVRVEVSDGDATCVFVLFDSCMSYLMEKSCAEFVVASKIDGGGSYPPEFDGLIGKSMLFTIDKSVSLSRLNDGSFRVKRICMEPRIIEKICAEDPFNTPSKAIVKPPDLDPDSQVDELDDDDSMPLALMRNIVVTPSSSDCSKVPKSEVVGSVRRNLAEDFNDVAKVEVKKRARLSKKDK